MDNPAKVILFSYTNYPSLVSNLEKEGVKMSQGDLLRHGSFTFDLQGVSRAASHQIVRHRIASFSQQCYDSDTEILTDYGWKRFGEFTRDLKVATLDPNTFEVEYQIPTASFLYQYNGPMNHFQSKQVDLMVTPNHKLFVKVYGRTRWELLDASTVSQIAHGHIEFKKDGLWVGGEDESYLTIPGATIVKPFASGESSYQRQDISIPYRDFLDFLGYFISEGCVCESLQNGSMRHIVEVSQNAGRFASNIETCISNLPFHAYRSIDKTGCVRWRIEDKSLFEFLKPLGKAHQKFIPRWVLNRNPADLRVLFRSLIEGDGSVDKKSGWMRYFTTSKRLADDVQELAFKLGHGANISYVKARPPRNPLGCYMVSIMQKGNTPLIRLNGTTTSKHEVVLYRGFVWCVEVPNHIVYVRRKGKPVWCGNSQRYVKITRSYGYLKPSGIPENLRVPVEIHGRKMDLNFADVMDLTRQAEEGLVAKGIKAEDSRYLRPNAATTNIVMSMSPRQLIHFFNLRCAPDAQWEIRDLAWSMYATVILAAPGVFGRLPAADESDYVKKRVEMVQDLVGKQSNNFKNANSGELFHLETKPYIDLGHPVESFVRKY
jgi:Thymidylate synthase complementing protein/LAGLIDADG-like domain